jgi:pilus assembly protein CpaB
MNRRAAFIALIAAMACVTLLLIYLRQYERETSGGERIRLLVAVKPLSRGMRLTEMMLASREVPAAYVDARAIKEIDKVKVIGIAAATSVQAQDVLMWTDLALGNDERDLSTLIQPGNRAVTVRATDPEETKVHALIHPGDYVDILAVLPDPSTTRGGGPTDARVSVVLLQKALVLAVGLATLATGSSDTTHQMSTPQRDLVLTLSLDVQEAQLMALAGERGRLSVAIRNPEDQRIADALPDMASEALFDSKTRADIQKVRRSGSVAPTLVAAPAVAGPTRMVRR